MNINEIAKLSKVSKGTVSRVLNGGSVKPETRERVLKVIRENNYVPSHAARSLFNRKSNKVLVVLPNFSNPFYVKVIEGISKSLAMKDYKMLLYVHDHKNEPLESFIDLVRSGTADGAIVLENISDESTLKKVVESTDVPIVQCSEYNETIDIPTVTIDNYKASRDACQHLVDSGCKFLYFVNAEKKYTFSKLRKQGFVDICKENNINYEVIDTTLDIEGGLQALDKINLDSNMKVGVFCISDVVAFGIIKGAHKKLINIPDSLAIVGFDNIELCEMITPELTTVSQEMSCMGAKAGELIIEYIENGEVLQQKLIYKHKLIKRNTT
ncbi:MAG: LacI family DNA-binding transcriptional regulator [Bacilli bacterium]